MDKLVAYCKERQVKSKENWLQERKARKQAEKEGVPYRIWKREKEEEQLIAEYEAEESKR